MGKWCLLVNLGLYSLREKGARGIWLCVDIASPWAEEKGYGGSEERIEAWAKEEPGAKKPPSQQCPHGYMLIGTPVILLFWVSLRPNQVLTCPCCKEVLLEFMCLDSVGQNRFLAVFLAPLQGSWTKDSEWAWTVWRSLTFHRETEIFREKETFSVVSSLSFIYILLPGVGILILIYEKFHILYHHSFPKFRSPSAWLKMLTLKSK